MGVHTSGAHHGCEIGCSHSERAVIYSRSMQAHPDEMMRDLEGCTVHRVGCHRYLHKVFLVGEL